MKWTLESLRVAANMTQPELAETLGVSSATIARMENDSTDIKLSLLIKYLDFFNVDFNDIFLGEKYRNSVS